MIKSKFTKPYVKWGILIVALLVLLLVPLLKGSQVGSEAYLNQRLAEDLSFNDDLSFDGRFASYSWGTPLVLSIAPSILVWILPLILGLLSIVFLRRIIKKFTQKKLITNLVMAIFVLSPSFIYTFSSANSLFIALFLAILSFYTFSEEKLDWLSLILILILPIFNLMIAIGLLVCLALYVAFVNKKKEKLFWYAFGLGLLSSLVYYLFIFYQSGWPDHFIINALSQEFWKIFIYDLGSNYGIGVFILILASLGAMKCWDKKYSSLFVSSSIVLLFLCTLLKQEAVLLLNLFLIFLAGLGLQALLERKWSRANFRDFAIIIVLCGLVFSMVSQATGLVNGEPGEEIIEGLAFLEQLDTGVVFSEESRGVWINSAGHSNVIDENNHFIEDYEERLNDSQVLYYSRDLEISMEIFDKYGINYVWIDSGFKEEIWEYDSEGLLFILEYTKDFKQLYNKDGVEIWRIQR
jgi:hypothetical protein